MDTCLCGQTPVIFRYVEPPLFEDEDAIIKTVSFCSGCLKVDVVDIAYVAASTMSAHA